MVMQTSSIIVENASPCHIVRPFVSSKQEEHLGGANPAFHSIVVWGSSSAVNAGHPPS